MATLVGPGSKRIALGPRCLVGRGETSDVCLRDIRVSAEHAVLKWTDRRWSVRDLGSLNGVYLNGERVAPGAQASLQCGARLGFGNHVCEWVLQEDDDPRPRARRLSDNLRIQGAEGGLLLVPGTTSGGVSIYPGAPKGWKLDCGDEPVREVVDQEVIVVDGVNWLLELPVAWRSMAPTAATESTEHRLALRFRVSRTQEHVEIDVISDARIIRTLPDRAHNQMLLQLARERLEDDHVRGLPEQERGWINIDDLARKLGSDVMTLTVHIWRARKAFAAAKIANGAGVVERRKYSGVVRLGCCVREIVSL